MKKIIALFLSLLCIFCMVACGTYNPATGNGDSSQSSSNGGEASGLEFTVSLTCEGEPFALTEEIYAQWTGVVSGVTTSFQKSKIGADGKASIRGLDGEYRVTLSALPEGYGYNPNIYFATNDYRDTTIELIKLNKQPTKKGKDGTGEYKAIELTKQGLYVVELKNAQQRVHYEYYIPNDGGVYIVESWCDTTANVVNPIAQLYTGNTNAKSKGDICDKGILTETGYTTNFQLKGQASDEQQGFSAIMFAVYATERNDNFPVQVYFNVYKEAEYEDPYKPATVIRAAKTDMSRVEESGTWVPAYTKTEKAYFFDSTNYYYNEEDGYYHVGSLDGPYLYARIGAVTEFIPDYIDMSGVAHPVWLTNMETIVPSSPLSYVYELDWKTGNRTGNYLNYKYFIEQDYGAHCNSNGDVRVTEELRWFLQAFTIGQAYFYDGNGVVENFKEAEGYNVYALESNQWTFICGYYV